ncbi:PAS domain-containing hybrid sensor histidine kinase/response regulator [Sphingomonas faeni]|uniref:PAS domain-containing hybrid sensor histidine kinase/response regulator n=1 Tax=Sphingomonas faeni TaxID=185950 RepID=UPI002781698D|nr:hybrid sensor histidine kinase/response regulator [Sphingomonas faeni]MDQ0837273.1 signal transduction histidine kinase [Sphingomonas faeni]
MDDRVLILAPRGRDAAIASDLLGRNDIVAFVCRDQTELVFELNRGAAAVMLTEEALTTEEVAPLAEWVAAQPNWADIQFVVLANGTRTPRTERATQRLADLGNVLLLERPLHAEAMLGAIRSAITARRRQYELRDVAVTLERAVLDRTSELRTARESLEIALEAAGMGSWDIDLETGVSRRTQRHDAIYGYPEGRSEWSLETFLSHVDVKQRGMVTQAMTEATKTGAIDVEYRIDAADGESRWLVAKGRVQYDDAGKATRMTGVVSDVTDRKEADAQLAQAQKMDAIGQLTGGVAHDFNNLLTPIVGSLDLLRRRHKDDERTQRMIGGALQAAERAATLTQRLLAFARRQALQPRAVDIGALIDGLVDLMRRSLGPSIAVTIEIPRHLSSARVDPNQLELALLNLAINARDAMPGGGKLTLTVSEIVVDERNVIGLSPDRYVRIAAIDTGVGMDRATLARATEPFFSTKGVGKGTGLGLSMVHGLAAQSGGTLRLTSEPGSGTTVELWLPATEEAAVDTIENTAEPVTARRAAKVLLVDDEDLVRAATADMLRDIGYVVVEVSSASQALSAIRSGVDADVLVSDYLMPGMTGGQLISELWSAGNRIPALLVTGYAAAGEDVPEGVIRLSKPFRQTDLAARVDELLRQSPPGRPKLRAVE